MLIGLKQSIIRFRFSYSLNHYTVLGLNDTATQQQIKAKYYQLAKIHHPDAGHQTDKGQFIKIKQAYEVLGNNQSKGNYDRKIRRKQNRQNQRNSYEYQQQYHQKYRYGTSNDGLEKRQKNILKLGIIAFFCSALYFVFGFKRTKLTEYQVVKNNIMLRKESANSTPGVVQRRRKMFEEQRKAKKFSIVPITIHFDLHGNAYTNQDNIIPSKRRESTKRNKKNPSLDNLPGIRKKAPKRDPVERQGSQDYI